MSDNLPAVVDWGERYVPAPKDDAVTAQIIARCFSGAVPDGGLLHMINMPTEPERNALTVRLQYLNTMLQSNAEQIGFHVNRMLRAYRDRGVLKDEDVVSIVKLYVQELQLAPAVPTWVAAQACMSIRRGERQEISVTHGVKTPELRRLCDSLVWGHRVEIDRIERILSGIKFVREPSDDERSFVRTGITKLAAEFLERNNDKVPLVPMSADELRKINPDFDKLPDAKSTSRKVEALKVVEGKRKRAR